MGARRLVDQKKKRCQRNTYPLYRQGERETLIVNTQSTNGYVLGKTTIPGKIRFGLSSLEIKEDGSQGKHKKRAK